MMPLSKKCGTYTKKMGYEENGIWKADSPPSWKVLVINGTSLTVRKMNI